MEGVTGSDADAPEQTTPGFGERGRMRRRARFLRKARELAYRDLGGLVFDLHRFGVRNDEVVRAKLSTLAQMDAELRALEQALGRHQGVTVLREVGIAACPRCAAIHGRDDRFCPGCGLEFDANAQRPLSTAPVSTRAPAPAGLWTQSPVPSALAPSDSPPSIPGASPTPPSSGSVASSPPATHPQGPRPTAAQPSTSPVRAGTPARPTTPAPAPTPLPDSDAKQTEGEEEPTQILNPQVRGA
jgi:hypothetical protein